MKKITIITLHLGFGGIERCVASLANALSDNYKIEIVSIYKLYDKPGFDINKNIKITYLLNTDLAIKVRDYKIMFFSFKWFELLKLLFKDYISKGKIISLFSDSFKGLKLMLVDKKKALKNYLKTSTSDVYITTNIDINNILNEYKKDDSYKIAWEHNHPHGNIKYANKVINSVTNYNSLVVVSNNLKKYYKNKVNCLCLNIPNTIDNTKKKQSKLNNKRLISVGRLSKEKGYIDLLKTFKVLNEHDKEYTLDIVGDGYEKTSLETFIKDNKLKDFVKLHGFQKNDYIDKLLENSSLYLMSSYTESFGIVLLEAMAHGIPCVAFSSAEGAKEIIKNNKNGYLIDHRNKVIMAKKIDSLINNKEKLKELGKNAKETVKDYTMDKIKQYWIDLIEKK